MKDIFQIEWESPERIPAGKNSFWIRRWFIPPEITSVFLQFWKENIIHLKLSGFSLKQKNSKYYLEEKKFSPNNFLDVGQYKDPNFIKIEENNNNFSLPSYQIKNNCGLRSWQTKAVERLVSAIKYWNAAIDGSDCGIGKTYQAIAVARELNKKFLVICPKQVIVQWKKIISEHFKLNNLLIDVINYEKIKFGNCKNLLEISVTKNAYYKRKSFVWKIPKNSLIIWDEAQKLKNWNTKNSKMCIKAFEEGYPQLFLSATMASSPLELRTVGTCLKLFEKGSKNWYNWLEKHGCFVGNWGFEFTNNKSIRTKVLTKINKELFEKRGVRLRRDTIPEFPKCDIHTVLMNMDGEDVEKINEAYKKMEAEISKITDLKELAQYKLVYDLRCRQEIELVKVHLFVEMIEEYLENGFSVVVFLNFTDSIKAISERTNIKCIYDGTITTEKEREFNKNLFQENKERVILVNSACGGSGLSLHDIHGNHPRISLISPNWSAIITKQILGRIWRDDSKTKAMQKIIFIANTIEENIYNKITTKLENMDLINDGDLSYDK